MSGQGRPGRRGKPSLEPGGPDAGLRGGAAAGGSRQEGREGGVAEETGSEPGLGVSWKQLRPHASHHPEARHDVHVQFAAFGSSQTGLPSRHRRQDTAAGEDRSGEVRAVAAIAREMLAELQKRLARWQRAGAPRSANPGVQSL